MHRTRLVDDLHDLSRASTGKLRLTIDRFDMRSVVDAASSSLAALLIVPSRHRGRSETFHTSPGASTIECIIPAEAFFEPDWRSGKAVPTRIARADGEPMGIASLWSWWKSPRGELVHSYAC